MDEKQKTHVPYRPMPRRYVLAWIVILTATTAATVINSYGWAALSSGELLVQIIGTGLLGGLFWGWVLWRLGLYRQFPNL